MWYCNYFNPFTAWTYNFSRWKCACMGLQEIDVWDLEKTCTKLLILCVLMQIWHCAAGKKEKVFQILYFTQLLCGIWWTCMHGGEGVKLLLKTSANEGVAQCSKDVKQTRGLISAQKMSNKQGGWSVLKRCQTNKGVAQCSKDVKQTRELLSAQKMSNKQGSCSVLKRCQTNKGADQCSKDVKQTRHVQESSKNEKTCYSDQKQPA